MIIAAGSGQIHALLRSYRIPNAAAVAAALTAAAGRQTVTLPGQLHSAAHVEQLANDVLTCHDRLSKIDAAVNELLGSHPLAPVITSLPGIGTQLAAELIAYTNNLAGYDTPGRLAAHAGLVPVAHDSGTVTGNHRRPRRYHRGLRRVFYLSARIASRACPRSRAYYEKKRAEGKTHHHALLALARRRVNVLWALVRDHTLYRP
jgi:transposase